MTEAKKALPQIIQGGMGVAVSNYRLANAVAKEGQMGVVSGTGIAMVFVHHLWDGDVNGDMRRALAEFPDQAAVKHILDGYFREPGTAKKQDPTASMYSLKQDKDLTLITVLACFTEVWLGKEGHDGMVGINLLEKAPYPNLFSIYGAILANVDTVIMGAGIPLRIAKIIGDLVEHKAVSYAVEVAGAEKDDEPSLLHFDPKRFFTSNDDWKPLKRPMWIPIVSSLVLAKALLKRSEGKIDAFIIEHHTAGGHNAPPRKKQPLDDKGQPIYNEKDEVDFEKFNASIEEPFWLAGGRASPEGLKAAQDFGAVGIQIGTAFAHCDESGFSTEVKKTVIQKSRKGTLKVLTDGRASPTGFPFKVLNIEGTLSEPDVVKERPRVCDMGLLRYAYKRDNGSIGYRCASEPVEIFVKKGGNIDETVGRLCLCNALVSAAAVKRVKKNGYIEPELITSGDDAEKVFRFAAEGKDSYTAKEVIDAVLG
ncbi:MAG: nitronate monooxygenase [Deltaproteobacteria bacterium]|nr:nitronate monooxygenase [Deltaproteobacteria bacterium]